MAFDSPDMWQLIITDNARPTNKQTNKLISTKIEFPVSDSKMSASEVFSEILGNIQRSNLNFSVNFTPFSAYITIRKSFVKSFTPPTTLQPLPLDSASKENILLGEQNEQLLQEVRDLDNVNAFAKETIKILEEKISKVETSSFKLF